jgi:hypothetical protein
MSFLKRWEIAASKAAPRGRARRETSGQATVTKKRSMSRRGWPSPSHGGVSAHGLSGAIGSR